MTATTAPALTKDQLERAILLEVVTRFVNTSQSTSRYSLVVKFDGQSAGQLLFELQGRSLLYRQSSGVPTDDEKYLPGALAFEFCGDKQFRENAKFATTVVLHTVKPMYKSEQNKKEGFTFGDLERYAAHTFPDKHIDGASLRLGLYLAKNFSVLGSVRPPDGLEIEWFQVAEWAMSIANPDTEWDAMVFRSTPRQPELVEIVPVVKQGPAKVRKQHQVFLPAGSQHEAYVRLRKIFTLAKREILIVDNYVDHTLWELLTNTKPKVKIRILTDHMKGDFRLEGHKFAAQYGKAVEVRKASNYHDRFIIQDGERCWHVGASIKDAGSKAFAFSELVRSEVAQFVVADVNTQWSSATVVAL
jgi:hypothetical protein